MQSSLHLVIFKHPYLTHTKSDFRNFSAMNSALHFLHIYHLDFHLKKKILPSNFEKILWSNKFLTYPQVEIILYKNQDGSCFLWDFRLWILTIQPFRSYTLAYSRPFHLISTKFQNIENNQGSPPKKKISSPSIVIILQTMRSLWMRFFLQTISIERYKILQLELEKHHFILIISPPVNKYIFQGQYSPKWPWNFRG
jgi:hypothetical protein